MTAFAADDGQTQPRITTGYSSSYTTASDIISTTSGAGNVKGIACKLPQDANGLFPAAVVKIYVNGGSAQSLTLNADYMPTNGAASYAEGYTGWVPMNVRFTSSIRVTLQKTYTSGLSVDCAVSWALD